MSDVLAAFSAYPLDCDGSGGDWLCSGHYLGTTTYFEVSTYGPSASKLSQVTAAYSMSGSTSKRKGMAFLRHLAGLPYGTGNPSRAIRWLEESWADAKGFTPAEIDIGDGHFVLRVLEGGGGADYSLELYAAGDYYN